MPSMNPGLLTGRAPEVNQFMLDWANEAVVTRRRVIAKKKYGWAFIFTGIGFESAKITKKCLDKPAIRQIVSALPEQFRVVDKYPVFLDPITLKLECIRKIH